MSRLIYVKFNSFRRPDYRISTEIVDDGGKLSVIKRPMNKASEANVAGIADKYDLLRELYTDIKPIPCEKKGDSVVFPYINGTELLSDIDLQHLDEDGLYKEIDKALGRVFAFNAEAKPFVKTDRFTEIFGDLEPKESEESYPVTNIDSNLDNFLSDGEQIWCIDYEWVADFPVPIRFVKYRTLLYFYTKNYELIDKSITVDGIFSHYGFSGEDIELFAAMDDHFQQFVHGEDRKYILTSRYEREHKPINEIIETADTLPKVIELKDQHIANLNEQIVHLNKVIAGKDDIIDNLESDVEERDSLIGDLESDVKERDILIGNLDRAVKDRDYAIEQQASHIEEYRRALRNPLFATKLAVKKIKNRMAKPEEAPTIPYDKWIAHVESLEAYEDYFEYKPKISVILPVCSGQDKHLAPCIESVLGQKYKNFEICIAYDGSLTEDVRTILEKYKDNPKVKTVSCDDNANCANSALELATGEYTAFLDGNDLISPNALYEAVKELNKNKDLDFIYSDEDRIDSNGSRCMPHFKPDWSPDTLMSFMYTGKFGIYRTDMVRKIGGLREGFDGAKDYDFVLRFTEQTTADKIGHIAKILYHCREWGNKTDSLDSTRKVKEEALARRGLKAELEQVSGMEQWRVNYTSKTESKVSIIIPSKDNPELLKQCLDTLTGKTIYKNYEVIVVDNGSSDENRSKYEQLIDSVGGKYIYEKEDFNFSYMCNLGASKATGGYYLFLNDDIEIIDGEWLGRMLGQAELPHAGAVGAKLLYPGGDLIQHCGVFCIGVGPVHAFGGMTDSIDYYFGRNKAGYNWSAVTAACLLVSAEKFNAVNGFDETFKVTYNDVELCFRLYEAGYYNVVRNDVVLNHHESASRGDDRLDEAKMQRLIREKNRLYDLHPKMKSYDPFYNINLTQTNKDFSNNLELIGYKPSEHTIEYAFDSLGFRGSKGYLRGWAYETSADAELPFVKAELVTESGREPEGFESFAISRRDVVNLRHLPNETEDNKYGFSFEWELDENETYYLRFTSGVSSRYYKIDVEGALRRERERKRKYTSESEMIAADDPYREADDKYYQETFGQEGYKAVVKERLNCSNVDYDIWREHNLLPKTQEEEQRKAVFELEPVISIAVPLYRTPEKYLREMIESVLEQTYSHLELCLADGSMNDSVEPVVQEYMQKDPRIKYVRLDSNLGISENTNEALKLATGDYVALLDHDDYLEIDALYEIVKRINETGADVVYTDEDKCSSDRDLYYEPNFKPDFNKEYLFSCNYITHFFVAKSSIVNKVGMLDPAYDGSQDYDFILRCTQEAKRIEHIARVLYHWRCHWESTAMNPEAKMYCYEAGRKAIEAALKRDGEESFSVEHMPYLGLYHTVRRINELPRIHIISIPENREWIERHIKADRITADYVSIDSFFDSAIPDDAEYVLYLGIKIKRSSKNWLDQLVSNCSRDGIGAVSGRIVGNGGMTIHSGLVIQKDGSIRDLYYGEGREVPGILGRNILAQDIDAAIPVCLIVRAEAVRNDNIKSGNSVFSRSVILGKNLSDNGMRMVYLPDVTLIGEDTKEFVVPEEHFNYTRLLYSPNYDPDGALHSLRL